MSLVDLDCVEHVPVVPGEFGVLEEGVGVYHIFAPRHLFYLEIILRLVWDLWEFLYLAKSSGVSGIQ